MLRRGESYSVQDRTGPRTGLDRTGPVQFGLVLGPPNFLIRSSVRSRSGPVDRIKWVARSCPSARPDCAPKKIGGTAVPCGTGTPCHFSTLSIPGPVRSGPVQGLTGPVRSRTGLRPVRSSVRTLTLIRSSVQTGPVRDRITALLVYLVGTCLFILVN